ncbi:adenylate kinase [Sphingobium sp. B2D3A]|uniref:ATP-binding protein n=1 Tax=unclassified Sphingobium TaxID=2611147 RepID=UPI002224B89F|nr:MULTISPECIES: ATP-binding protein [unclassified Sphingobium]MCW2339161.1 adenylate kinase [Sphingobium sp. B2D3A]MCW2386895.1 adenylate kinase [Sphingobium sp. B2D3D]
MTKGPVIAILGLSGSGKSYLGRSIVRARPEYLRLSAGGLLRRSFHTTGEKLRTAEGGDVRENQTELVGALAEARVGQWERPVLLEAHSFIDNDRELVDVPVEVMASLELAGIILVDVPAEQIATRRNTDKRKRPQRSLAELKRQCVRSKSLANGYASDLGIPLVAVNSGEKERALAFLDALEALQSPKVG